MSETSGQTVRRPLFWWDVAVPAVLLILGALGAASAIGSGPSDTTGRVLITLAPVAALALWYLWPGRGALERATLDQAARPTRTLFVAGLVIIIGVATGVEPSFAALQVLGHPMIWTVVERYRAAVAWTAALALATGAGFVVAVSPSTPGEVAGGAAMLTLLSFASAVAIGTWITRIFTQKEQYRALAQRLRESQQQVAELSEAAGAAAERERLSRELHDTLTQTLTGLVMLTEQADRALAGDGPRGVDLERARDRMSRVASAAREAVTEARALVATTQPLADGGLEASITRVAARLEADTGLRVRCDLQSTELDRERQVVILRAVQEGLANARKHAKATEVRVRLSQGTDGTTVLEVEDDGTGPRPDRMADSGFGLTGLADRVRTVGGEVEFGPGRAGGSLLLVRIYGGET